MVVLTMVTDAVRPMARPVSVIKQVARDDAVYDLQHRRHQHRLGGQQQSLRNRQ